VLVSALFVQHWTDGSAEYPVNRAGTAQRDKAATTVCGVQSGAQRLIRCVGAIIHDDTGRLLLVRRATEPGRGRWSLPGGRVESGESDAAALRREVLEETGLLVEVGPLLGAVRRPSPSGDVYDIYDYRCLPRGSVLTPGDDASDACWASAADYEGLPLVDGLTDALSEWSALPR
jgi:8-oxo-dGTP diphosphatase